MLGENRRRVLDDVEGQHAVDEGEHGAASGHDLPILKVVGGHIRVDPRVVAELALAQETLDVLFHRLLGLVAFLMETALFLIRLVLRMTYRVARHSHADSIVFICHAGNSGVVSTSAHF